MFSILRVSTAMRKRASWSASFFRRSSQKHLSGNFSRVGLSLLLMASLFSCTDKKAATKSNIRAAVQQALVDDPQCLPFSFPAFAPQRPSRGDANEQLQTLVSAGLVHMPHPAPKGSAGWGVPSVEYDLTPLGQKYQRTVTLPLFRPQTRLCYAQRKVTAIDSYTEPASFFGRIVTTVTYQYRLHAFASWAQQPAIVEAFHLDHDLQLKTHPETAEIALTSTSEGWRATR